MHRRITKVNREVEILLYQWKLTKLGFFSSAKC